MIKFLIQFKTKIATMGEKSIPEPNNPNERNKFLNGPNRGSVRIYKYLYNWLLLLTLNQENIILPKISRL